jgi:hypothetical protein
MGWRRPESWQTGRRLKRVPPVRLALVAGRTRFISLLKRPARGEALPILAEDFHRKWIDKL